MGMHSRYYSMGFTLIEIVVVVAIIGILAAIALPSYTEFVNKGRRSDGLAALLEIANRQEQFLLDRNTYTTNLAQLGLDNTSDEGYYTLQVNDATAACPITRCYSLTATATGAQSSDKSCSSFTLGSNGVKSAKNSGGSTVDDCWSK